MRYLSIVRALVAVSLASSWLSASLSASAIGAPAAGFKLPAGATAQFTNGGFDACNNLTWGYQLDGVSYPQESKSFGCFSQSVSAVTVGPFLTDTTITVFLTDNSCNFTYYSDGTPVDHVIVEGSNPYALRFADGGGSCERTQTTTNDFQGYNFRVDLKINVMTLRFVTPPPAEVAPTVYSRTGYAISRVNVSPLQLTAEVDENGQPVTQALTLHVDETSADGGNTRGAGATGGTRPHAWLLKTTDQQPSTADVVPQSAIGGSQDTSGLEVTTGASGATSGQASFVWLAPETAGTETLKLTVIGHPEIKPLTANVDVRIDGLTEMPTNPTLYLLIGSNEIHPGNHFATSNAISALTTAAQDYITNQQNDQQLQHELQKLADSGYSLPEGSFPSGTPDLMQINDISLPWGGLFDVNGDWTTPHGGHRWGDTADFRTNYLVGNPIDPKHTALGDPNSSNKISNAVRRAHLLMFNDLTAALQSAGGTILFEANHLHVVF